MLLISGIIVLIIAISISLLLSNTKNLEPVSVEPQIIKVTLKEGEKLEQKLKLTNLINKRLTVYPKLIGLNGKIDERIELEPYGARDAFLYATIPEGEYGTFAGEAQFLTEKYGKGSSLIIIDSETKSIEFDATIEQAVSKVQNFPGNEITFLVNLYASAKVCTIDDTSIGC